MRTFSAPTLAALASGNVVLAVLVRIDFPSGTVGLNSTTWPLTYNGLTYLGAAGLGAIEAITDTPDTIPGLQLMLQRVDATNIALALDDADQVQGATVSIYTAIVDSATYTVLDVGLDWKGSADTMPITEDGQTASIGLTAESKAVDLLRGHPMVYNDADQQALYPGDRGFEYVVSQSNEPVVWPTRAWFTK